MPTPEDNPRGTPLNASPSPRHTPVTPLCLVIDYRGGFVPGDDGEGTLPTCLLPVGHDGPHSLAERARPAGSVRGALGPGIHPRGLRDPRDHRTRRLPGGIPAAGLPARASDHPACRGRARAVNGAGFLFVAILAAAILAALYVEGARS